eukprot:5014424-Prymnesium_polylepis.1
MCGMHALWVWLNACDGGAACHESREVHQPPCAAGCTGAQGGSAWICMHVHAPCLKMHVVKATCSFLFIRRVRQS